MAKFNYIAISSGGSTVHGSVESSDRATATLMITKQDLKLVSLRETTATKRFNIDELLSGGKVKSDALVMFTRQLSAMISAGVPLLRSLSTLAEHAESKPLKKVLDTIVHDVESGAALADALEKHPNTFSDVYVNMVRAGEAAGILDDILKRLASQQEKASSMRKKIKSAMTYPMVLIGITVIAFFGLMFFVIPQIGKIIQDLGGPDAQLPALTLIMLGISDFLRNYWYIVFGIAAAVVFITARFLKTPQGKRLFHTLILRVPAVGAIVKKVAIARFSRTYSALMGAGVPVLEALHVSSRAIGNKVYEETIVAAGDSVKNGKQLSTVLTDERLFPSILSQMLAVGEETGETGQVLVKVADFYEEEVDAAIEGVSSIIEPVMIVVMGGVVGLVAASVMLPIASLSQNIKG